MKSCLIIGAGMAGLTAARELQRQDWRVLVVDKGRNAGGRMATRRRDGFAFDHGAQFFTVRRPEFRQAVEHWLAQGWVKPWFGEPEHERYCGVDGMSGLASRWGEGVEVRLGVTVRGVSRADGGWSASSDAGEPFLADALIVTVPVPQALNLLEPVLPLAARTALEPISYDPCLALMVRLAGVSAVPEPGYLRCDEPGALAVISDNARKGISSGAAVTLHSTAEFARAHWDGAPEAVAALMLEAARPYVADVIEWRLHRWRYSQPVAPYPSACFPVETGAAPLVLAGDAFGGPRVEGAFLSGLAAARSVAAV